LHVWSQRDVLEILFCYTLGVKKMFSNTIYVALKTQSLRPTVAHLWSQEMLSESVFVISGLRNMFYKASSFIRLASTISSIRKVFVTLRVSRKWFLRPFVTHYGSQADVL